jgi:hypothetical protein
MERKYKEVKKKQWQGWEIEQGMMFFQTKDATRCDKWIIYPFFSTNVYLIVYESH